jgi:hypothetical protein
MAERNNWLRVATSMGTGALGVTASSSWEGRTTRTDAVAIQLLDKVDARLLPPSVLSLLVAVAPALKIDTEAGIMIAAPLIDAMCRGVVRRETDTQPDAHVASTPSCMLGRFEQTGSNAAPPKRFADEEIFQFGTWMQCRGYRLTVLARPLEKQMTDGGLIQPSNEVNCLATLLARKPLSIPPGQSAR